MSSAESLRPAAPTASDDTTGRHPATGGRRRAVRAAAITASLLCATGAIVVAGQAFAAETPADARGGHHPGRPPAVPAAITPPDTVRPVARYRVATGAQVYVCKGGVFTFKAPEATLVHGRRSLHHFAGPSWQSTTDGSLVTAAKIGESAVPGAIPQLLLQVNKHSGDPKGELAAVTYIQRLDTSGGTAPAGACTDGVEQAVPYHAEYVFFAPR